MVASKEQDPRHLTVAVFGAGKMGGRHLGALRKMEGLSLVVADVDGSAARALAEPEGIPWRDDVEAALADPGIDAAFICTPVPFHGEQVERALRSGKHVFCEKPLCRTEKRALAILDAARAGERVVQTGFLSRYAPAFVQVKQWLEHGLLGPAHLAVFRIGGRGSHRGWKHQKASGGGVVMEMLTHKLDLALWLFGPVEAARTFVNENLIPARTIGHERVEADAEDLFLAEAQAGGARIIFLADFLSPSYIEYLEVHGKKGSIFASMLERLPTTLFLKEAAGGYDAGLTTLKFHEVDLVERELEDFFEKIRSPGVSHEPVEDALNLVRALRFLGVEVES